MQELTSNQYRDIGSEQTRRGGDRGFVRAGLLAALAALVAVVGAAATVTFSNASPAGGQAATAERFASSGHRWPGDPAKIRFTIKRNVHSKTGAILAAVNAWDSQNLDFRLKSASRPRMARLIFTETEDFRCGQGSTTPKYNAAHQIVGATIYLGNSKADRDMDDRYECQFADTLNAAHEIGHALGLEHEGDSCATMAPRLDLYVDPPDPLGATPESCSGGSYGVWYCRTLSGDDLRGAQSLYGGDFKVAGKEFCPVVGSRLRTSGTLNGVADDPATRQINQPFDALVAGK